MTVWVVDAVRTPIGRYGGALAGVRPDDLAAHVLGGLVARSPSLDPARIDDVWFGNSNGAGEENRNVARMAVLLAPSLPTSVPGVTVNRLCGSGLEAVIGASRVVEVGDASVVVAGGVESMSRAPWVVPKPSSSFPRGSETMHSTTLGWRLVNPRMPPSWTVALGEGAELVADRFRISREAQDGFALGSHAKAIGAWDAGRYEDEISLVTDAAGEPLLERDESIRADTTLDALGRLRPSFRPDGTVTAGNASPLNDGAAAVLLADDAGLAAIDRPPLARIAARAVGAVDPQWFGLAPVEVAAVALKRAGVAWPDLSVVELNEAFASQALACLKSWPELDPAVVNPNGGALALGHPIGASGTRILTTLAWELHRLPKARWALATLCIGAGQSLALVLERP